jgi:PEP-CTERM motif
MRLNTVKATAARISACSLVAASAYLIPGLAHAANATFSVEGSFAAAAGAATIEGFETTAARLRSTAALTTSLFTLTSGTTPIGVQSGVNTPEDAFGAVATDGVRFVSVYLPNQPQGSLVFDLSTSATAFGFNITDAGETSGVITLRTDTGAYASGINVATFPPGFGNGNIQFYGLTQDQPFSRVFLTVTGNDEAYGLDKIYVTSVSAVPEPATALLMAAGFAVLYGARRRHTCI